MLEDCVWPPRRSWTTTSSMLWSRIITRSTFVICSLWIARWSTFPTRCWTRSIISPWWPRTPSTVYWAGTAGWREIFDEVCRMSCTSLSPEPPTTCFIVGCFPFSTHSAPFSTWTLFTRKAIIKKTQCNYEENHQQDEVQLHASTVSCWWFSS